jgi:2-amino-4-hydroxy-6-hydroxymethyldihydropteridine diphosphokinase
VSDREPMGEPTRAFLGLGSNLGDRVATLVAAVDRIDAADDVEVIAVSSLYETEPVGEPDQGLFCNVVVQVATRRDARGLLELAQDCERAAQRVRTRRWGPRTLDVDVLWVDSDERAEPDLEVPHPRMWQRRFVLAPLAELAPELVGDDLLVRAEGAVTRRGPLR